MGNDARECGAGRADHQGVRTKNKSNRWMHMDHTDKTKLSRTAADPSTGSCSVMRDFAQDDKPMVELRFGEFCDDGSDCAD